MTREFKECLVNDKKAVFNMWVCINNIQLGIIEFEDGMIDSI